MVCTGVLNSDIRLINSFCLSIISYNAVLISSLAVVNYKLPFQSINDLAYNDHKVALNDGIFYIDLFKNGSSNGIFNQIWKKKIEGDPNAIYSQPGPFYKGNQLQPARRKVLDMGYAVFSTTKIVKRYKGLRILFG